MFKPAEKVGYYPLGDSKYTTALALLDEARAIIDTAHQAEEVKP